MSLVVERAGPQMTVQDFGRPGLLAVGLSRGGAADRLALLEAAALLGGAPGAAIEMAGAGGSFRATAPLRIALTGAPMRAALGGRPLPWAATHRLEAGGVLTLGAAEAGTYGYLSTGGGVTTPEIMGSRSVHLVARIGARLAEGDELPTGRDPDPAATPMVLEPADRFRGGTVRVVPGAQTGFYSPAERERFASTTFTRDARGNRQGVRLTYDGAPFGAEGQRTVLSEIITPGDIQMTGDGVPFVLLPECQTTGGYPRIGSVLPDDLPLIAQAAPGATLRFRFVTLEEARAAHRPEAAILRDLRRAVRPLVRNPHDIADLLSYQLVSGATTGEEP